MIRPATTEDIPQLVALGTRFLAEHPMPAGASVNHLGAVLTWLIPSQFVCVVEHDGVLRGMLIGVLSHPWFDPSTPLAVELAWWVDPSMRGSMAGVRMLRAFESWATMHNAVIAVSDLVAPDGVPTIGTLTERLGYRLVERTFVKHVEV